ncbi:hypothetical protein Tco_0034638, partial [Tanacetum coccineum]
MKTEGEPWRISMKTDSVFYLNYMQLLSFIKLKSSFEILFKLPQEFWYFARFVVVIVAAVVAATVVIVAAVVVIVVAVVFESLVRLAKVR